MNRKDGIKNRLRPIIATALILILLPASSAAAEMGNETGGSDQPGALVLIPSKQDVTGNWRLILEDNVTRYANLTLYQADDAVFGYGNLTSENSTRMVSAGGSFEENLLELFFITQEEDLILRLVSVVDGGCLSGDYRGYAREGEEMLGNVSGCMYVSGETKSQPVLVPEPIHIDWSSWFDWYWYNKWHFDLFP
ncbi:hypothetical protein [Methanothrix harundinacea]|uniref:Lipoprotein, putative n=1 Tax=Methanothrix harundinacea (strain 6Ac) TaxID=1110509 RepID=G7WLV5_METH6|nr:hypothetical protein [Methanothrix harundinacea]AET63698.1 Lipoprotein, putative [Methanothrix harundinacea 6Ac]